MVALPRAMKKTNRNFDPAVFREIVKPRASRSGESIAKLLAIMSAIGNLPSQKKLLLH